VRTEGYARARELIIEAIRRIMDGEVSAKDLAISKVLRRVPLVICQGDRARLGGDKAGGEVKMVKEKGMQISPTRTSGICGRLMCCLQYEHDQGVGERKGEKEGNFLRRRKTHKRSRPKRTSSVRAIPSTQL
jgi:hypothetical protein